LAVPLGRTTLAGIESEVDSRKSVAWSNRRQLSGRLHTEVRRMMINRTQSRLLAVCIAMAVLSGCEYACRRPCSPALPAYSPYLPPSEPAPLFPSPAAAQPQLPAAPAIQMRGYEPPRATPGNADWQPSPGGGVRLAPPEIQQPVPVPVSPPQSSPSLSETPKPAPVEPSKPARTEDRAATPSLPVGIPQFALVQEQIAGGLKPLLDGLDWLGDNGYRTVLHVYQPGEDDSADRKQVERRGLKYVTLEVSPQTLSRKQVEQFNRIVMDTTQRPLFVYDKDGSLAGSLWYLHFRTAEQLSAEESRSRARPLGLKVEPKVDQQLMWLAVQKYLSEQGR